MEEGEREDVGEDKMGSVGLAGRVTNIPLLPLDVLACGRESAGKNTANRRRVFGAPP